MGKQDLPDRNEVNGIWFWLCVLTRLYGLTGFSRLAPTLMQIVQLVLRAHGHEGLVSRVKHCQASHAHAALWACHTALWACHAALWGVPHRNAILNAWYLALILAAEHAREIDRVVDYHRAHQTEQAEYTDHG